MNSPPKITVSIGTIITVVCFFQDSLNLYIKIIILLLALICWLGSLLFDLNKKAKQLNQTTEQTQSMHKALADEYQKISTQLQAYQSGFITIKQAAMIALSSTKPDRFKIFFELLLSVEKTTLNGGNNHGKEK